MKTELIIVLAMMFLGIIFSVIYLENRFFKQVRFYMREWWFNTWLFCGVVCVWFIDLFNKDKSIW